MANVDHFAKKSASRIFEKVTAKWTFLRLTVFFFGQKLSKVAVIKTNSAIIALGVSFSPFFFLR